MIKLAQDLLRKTSWFVAAFQALLVAFSLIFAWLLRFDFTLPNRPLLSLAIPILVLIRVLTIAKCGLLHGWWKYTGLGDAFGVVKAVSFGSAAFLLFMRYGLQLVSFPRSVYLLEPILTAGLLIGVRISSRALAESVRQDLTSSKKVIFIGAGVAAQTAAREIKRSKSGYVVLGYVDDDQSKFGLKIDGIPVLGAVNQLPGLVKRYPVDEILIAVPSASPKQLQRFVEICEQISVKFRTIPALADIITGRVLIRQFREVRIEDLLGRDPVEIDLESVRKQVRGGVVVVTGAGGSIGSELCRQVLAYEPQTLICVDQNETAVFYLQRELRAQEKRTHQVFCVADVGDRERMRSIFTEHTPHIVFHAAAYKHVPVMETNVQGAIKNNIFALLDLLKVAQGNGCHSFVLISSDKAVNPTSVMGVTKRIGELIISCRPTGGMRSVSVRFGNVLGSSGSVIPVFKDQIQNNQPLTITHREMRRFFMTTREAVSLVLQAFAIGKHGDTLVLDMGTPVRIVDLARTLIRLSGKIEQQVPIRFTGLREGEKLVEELFYSDEEVCPTSCPKIKRARGSSPGWLPLKTQLEELRTTMFMDGTGLIRAKFKEIVPEYSYWPSQHSTRDDDSEKFANAVGL